MPINTLNYTFIFRSVFMILVIFLPALLLSGCDSNGKSSKKSYSIQKQTQKYTKETTLKGQVSNKKGPIKSGEIKATDSNGKTVATSSLQNDNHYAIKIPAGTLLPLTLSFYPDEGNTAKDKLISVVIYSSMTNYDINELTTLIAKKAKALGGYTHTNMVLAADSTVGVPDANKTTTGFRGDPTKQYGGWH